MRGWWLILAVLLPISAGGILMQGGSLTGGQTGLGDPPATYTPTATESPTPTRTPTHTPTNTPYLRCVTITPSPTAPTPTPTITHTPTQTPTVTNTSTQTNTPTPTETPTSTPAWPYYWDIKTAHGTGTGCTVNYPTGIAAGNGLIAIISLNDPVSPPDILSGWKAEQHVSLMMYVQSRSADGTESGSAAWTWFNSTEYKCTILLYKNVSSPAFPGSTYSIVGPGDAAALSASALTHTGNGSSEYPNTTMIAAFQDRIQWESGLAVWTAPAEMAYVADDSGQGIFEENFPTAPGKIYRTTEFVYPTPAAASWMFIPLAAPQDAFTPTSTPTETPTETPTDTPTITPTRSPSPTRTITPTYTPTNTFTVTPTPTPTPTISPFMPPGILHNTVTQTYTPTATPTISPFMPPGVLHNTLTPTFLSPTPTRTQTPTITPSLTRTRTPTITNTMTPTLTPVGSTYTPTPSPTITPSPTQCATVLITGTVRDSLGQLIASKRITFESKVPQAAPARCVVRSSTLTVQTTAGGAIPDATYLLGGVAVVVTIEGGIGSAVMLPETGTVDFATLLSHPTPVIPAPDGVISNAKVSGSTEYGLGLDLSTGYGTLELLTQAVMGFSLTSDSSLGGWQIANLGTATTVGDAMIAGQEVGGDLTGTLTAPELGWVLPLATTATGEFPSLGHGECQPIVVALAGATSEMVAVASPTTNPGSKFVWYARSGTDQVTVIVCSLYDIGMTFRSTTFQVRAIRHSFQTPAVAPKTYTPTGTPTFTPTGTPTRTPTRTSTSTSTRTNTP